MPPFTYDPKELFAEITRLANERDRSWRFTKKGDKRPRYDVEAGQAARRANRKAKRDARIETLLAESRKRNSTARPAGEDIASRMLKVMEPGSWYGAGDLARMVGETRQARGKVTQVMLRRGWVEAAHNPAWTSVAFSPDEIEAGAEPQPRRLYRVTEKGLAVRAKMA